VKQGANCCVTLFHYDQKEKRYWLKVAFVEREKAL
jgi:hypothetical protein